jgi:Xaa-Pro aminopeptidase
LDNTATSKKSRRTALALAILEHYAVQEALVVPTSFPIDLADGLREAGYTIEAVQEWQQQRLLKSVQEVEMIRENVQGTCEVFRLLEDMLRASVIQGDTLVYKGKPLTSEYVKYRIESELLSRELECSEGLIVSCGVQAAMPHHAGAGALRPHQTIVADIFP